MTPGALPDLRQPDWFCQQIDVATAQALLCPMTPDTYRQSLFLDERMTPAASEQRVVSLAALHAALAAVPIEPASFVFHVGHCGSTLLTRLLEAAVPLLALREPVPLRALAAFQRDLDHPVSLVDPAVYPELLAGQVKLLTRRFEGGPATVIKPTSDCAPLAAPLLASHARHQALLVTLSLERYLETMLRSDLRRRELHHFAQSRLTDLHALQLAPEVRLYRLSIGELAALCWLSVLSSFHRLPPKQTFGVNFDTFLLEPEPTLAGLCASLGYRADPAAVTAAVQGSLMRGYSKDPTMAYSAQAREEELARSGQANRKEIAAGLRWAEKHAPAG
ncbi:MAG: hypothetical protein AAGA23_06785, partial [Pseudomonadota bacterium]